MLGRTTYEMFEPAWSTRTVEDDPGAPFFNDTTKFVVSASLTTATWRNSKIIGPYDPDTIRSLEAPSGTERAINYWSVYVLERSLSLDNIFVFLLVLDYFLIPREYRRRVVRWGIVCALALRALTFAVGAVLVESFSVGRTCLAPCCSSSQFGCSAAATSRWTRVAPGRSACCVVWFRSPATLPPAACSRGQAAAGR